MQTSLICGIALRFLALHVAPLDMPNKCDMFAPESGDLYTVSGDTPRAWSVTLDAHGRVLVWQMQDYAQ